MTVDELRTLSYMDSSHLEDGSQHVFEKGTLSEPATSTSFATKAKKGAGVLLDIFTPELFRRRRCKSSAHRNGPTAWLDGLRGWAAFGVCIMHLTVYTHDNFELCHNHTTDEGEVLNRTPLTLPFIRLPFTGGHFAVMLFFAISGYVVPRRLLSLLHKGNRVDFVESVHSAIIRRPIRLYLPVVLSTLFLWLSWHIFGITTPWPEHQANVFAEFAAWLLDMGRFFYIWRQKALYTIYNIHTWTIPVELRGSLFILVWLFATYRMSTRSRILMTVGMIMYLVLWTAGAMYAIFFAGMLTAELDLLATDGDIAKTTVPWERLNRALGSRRAIRGLAMHVLLVCGLYLAGQPAGDWIGKEEVLGSCPGWQNLAKLIPPAYNDGEASTYRWFWLFWSAWMVLVAIKEIGWVKWIFEASPSQCQYPVHNIPRSMCPLTLTARSGPPLLRPLPRPRPHDWHPRRAPLLPHRGEKSRQRRSGATFRPPSRRMEKCDMVAWISA